MIEYITTHWHALTLAYLIYIAIPATFLTFIIAIDETS